MTDVSTSRAGLNMQALDRRNRVRLGLFGPVPPAFGTECRQEYVFVADPVDPAALARLRAQRSEQNYHLRSSPSTARMTAMHRTAPVANGRTCCRTRDF
jgi:hypothetical protein